MYQCHSCISLENHANKFLALGAAIHHMHHRTPFAESRAYYLLLRGLEITLFGPHTN